MNKRINSAIAVIFRRDNQINLIKNSSTWELPGGAVKTDELIYPNAVIRAFKEESGIKLSPDRLKYVGLINGQSCFSRFLYLVEARKGEEPAKGQWIGIKDALLKDLQTGLDYYLKKFCS